MITRREGGFVITRKEAIQQMREELKLEWCLALHGNHDEHQCHKKPGHEKRDGKPDTYDFHHECYCGVWW